jgi:hypothetical protein
MTDEKTWFNLNAVRQVSRPPEEDGNQDDFQQNLILPHPTNSMDYR